MQPTFVIGPPRSGTTLLKDLLAAHPDLAVHGEDFHPFHHDLTRFRSRTERDDHFRLTAADACPELAVEYRQAVDRALADSGRSRFVLKISTLSIQVDYVRALFPEARFVQIVRDGRDAACSMEDLRRALERAQGTPRALGPAPDPASLWCAEQGYPGLVRAGVAWAYHATRSWLDLRFAGPEAYLRLRYEDLVRDPTGSVGRVLDFLEVSSHPAVDALLHRVTDAPRPGEELGFSTTQAPGAHRVGRYRDELPQDVRIALSPLLELPMRLLGYEPDPWPEAEAFYAACGRLGIDADQWRDRAKADAAWFALHHAAFAPERMLRPFRADPGARPLLVDGAVLGHRRAVVDGAVTGAVSVIQKQERRHELEDPEGLLPRLAPRLDGRTTLATLGDEGLLTPPVLTALERLYDLGFVALAP